MSRGHPPTESLSGPASDVFPLEDSTPRGILLSAARGAARCLHIDVTETSAVIRARVGGRLRKLAGISRETGYALADLLEDAVRGDEGLIELQGGAVMLRYRLAACPSARGQRLVVTLLPPMDEEEAPDLSKLGAPARINEFLSRQLDRRRGLMLVAGLEGSRRRRTILSLAGEIQNRAASVVRLADPSSGAEAFSDIPVLTLDPRADLARVLDQIDGMDADCLLFPEIRTATHVNLALAFGGSRRLIIAPVRAQDAADALVMLMDLGASRHRAASDLSGILAQQRLPRPCSGCAPLRPISEEEIPPEGWDAESRSELIRLAPEVRMRGVGCAACNGSGYAGWTTIYEVLDPAGHVTEAVRRCHDPGELREELKRLARGAGLLEAAWREVLDGNLEPSAIASVPYPEVVSFSLPAFGPSVRAAQVRAGEEDPDEGSPGLRRRSNRSTEIQPLAVKPGSKASVVAAGGSRSVMRRSVAAAGRGRRSR